MTANSDKITTRNRQFLMRQSKIQDAIKYGLIKLNYTLSCSCKEGDLTRSLQRIKLNTFYDHINVDLNL